MTQSSQAPFKRSSLWRPGINPTVDMVIFREPFPGAPIEVLCVRRRFDVDACPGMLAFPGGFVNSKSARNEPFIADETPEEAGLRELSEETGLSREDLAKLMKKVGYYDDQGRDPRSNDERVATSTAFAIFIKGNWGNNAVGGDDVEEKDGVKWPTLESLKNETLAFDHGRILKDAAALFNIPLSFEPCSWIDEARKPIQHIKKITI